MNLTEFEDGIGRYGTAIDTWPPAVRAAALALLAATPEAARLLEQARRLDRLFMVEACPPPPAVAAILSRAIAARPSIWTRLSAVLGPEIGSFSWLQASGLAACLVVGVIIGSVMTPQREVISLALLDFGVGAQSGFGAHLDTVDE